MENHFLTIHCYATKNKAHAEIQQYARQWHHAQVDDVCLIQLIEAFKKQITRINSNFPRCNPISLTINSHTYSDHTQEISVYENFYITIHKVIRTEKIDKKETCLFCGKPVDRPETAIKDFIDHSD